jgi:hypothetical protein
MRWDSGGRLRARSGGIPGAEPTHLTVASPLTRLNGARMGGAVAAGRSSSRPLGVSLGNVQGYIGGRSLIR